ARGPLGAAAAIGRPESGIGGAVPSILATVAGLGAFSRLRHAAGLATPVSAGETGGRLPPSFDRRRFLLAGTGAAGLAAVSGLAGRFLLRRAEAGASRAAVRIPAPAGGRRPAYPRRRAVHHTERPLLPGGYGAAGPLGHGRGMDAAGPWDGSQRAVARLPDPAVAAVDRA